MQPQFPRMPDQRNHWLGENWLKKNAPPHLQAAVNEQEQEQRTYQRAQAQSDQARRGQQQPNHPFYMPPITDEVRQQQRAEFNRQRDERDAEIRRQFNEEYEQQSHKQSSPRGRESPRQSSPPRGKGKKERSRSRSRSRNPIDDALSALGIHEDIASVTPQMIEHAYRKNSLSMHPDKIAQSRGRPATQAELDDFTTMGNKKEFLLELPEIKLQRPPNGGSRGTRGTRGVNARKSRSRRVKRRKTRHVRRATRHRR